MSILHLADDVRANDVKQQSSSFLPGFGVLHCCYALQLCGLYERRPNQLEVLQRDNYYAFGLRKEPVVKAGINKYLYNGK